MNPVAVICFLWGDWPGSGMGIEYVNRLRNSLLRNSSIPFDFICFVDNPVKMKSLLGLNIDSRFIPVPEILYKWNLRKIFMFDNRAMLQNYEWVVALDLDLIITGNIDFILQYRSNHLITCKAAYSNNIGGSVVGFDPSKDWTSYLVKYLKHNLSQIEKVTGGSERKFYRRALDLCILQRVEHWQNLFPDKIVSYKVDGFKEDASIIRFHGEPRPHELKPIPDWLKENWR